MEKNAEHASPALHTSPTSGRPGSGDWGDSHAADGQSRTSDHVRRRLIRIVLVVLIACLLLLAGRAWNEWARPTPPPIRGVLPGEFETCEAILLAPQAKLGPSQLAVFAEVAAHASQFLDVYVLVRHEQHRQAVADQFQQAGGAASRLRFLPLPFANAWVRDFGPVVVKSFDGGFDMLDFRTTLNITEASPERQLDDDVPQRVAAALGLKAVSVPLVLDGGNLLSNGAGLCISTHELQSANPGKSYEEIAALVREYLGGDQLILLEPLAGERTKHVDMFCTFTAPDTVVIAECNPAADPQNAAILDRNAEQLAQVRTHCGPLKVVRIPLPPPPERNQWATYTNVIYANGLLLVPSYAGVDAAIEQQVLATYRRLLPTWKVQSIDATTLLRGLGSLHCAAMNLHGTGKSPGAAPNTQ